MWVMKIIEIWMSECSECEFEYNYGPDWLGYNGYNLQYKKQTEGPDWLLTLGPSSWAIGHGFLRVQVQGVQMSEGRDGEGWMFQMVWKMSSP